MTLTAPFAGLSSSLSQARAQAPRSIRMANRKITVQGPQGYCIDRATKHANGQGDFILLGTCASISGNSEESSPPVRAVLSVSVLKAQTQATLTPEALRAHFETAAGQAVLAQSGNGADASLVDTRIENDALILHATDTSPARSAQLSDTYWRGIFPLNGHLVSLTVTPLTRYPVSQGEGQALMRNFVKSMQNANPAR